MKKIFGALIALYSAFAFSATTVPIQLLSPMAANTVVANATGSTASPTAISVPNCNSTAAALGYANGTGFNCNTTINASLLNGNSFPSPGPIGSVVAGTGAFTTLSATGNFTPSQTNGIVGTTTNNNANSGSVGETICAQVTNGGSPSGCSTNSNSPVALSNGVTANITSISLPAGDWDIWGVIFTAPAGTTTQSITSGAISTTSATIPVAPNGGAYFSLPFSVPAGFGVASPTGTIRELLATTTTIYLVVNSNFSVSTNSAYGFIEARRRR